MMVIYYRALKETRLQVGDLFRVGAWVNVENPAAEELDKLAAELALDRDLLADALDPFEVPRVESENGAVYIFTRVPCLQDQQTSTIPVLIVMGDTFVLTLSLKPLPLWVRFISGAVEFYTTQKTKFFFQIFKEIIRSYGAVLNDMGRQVRKVSVSIEKISSREITRFVLFESALNDFLAALAPTNIFLNNFLAGKFLPLYERDKDIMEDIFLSSGQLIESCKSHLKIIVNIRQAYSSIMTDNLNRVIKLLTSLTVVLTIPTIIASFWGMNVGVPLAGSPYAFWIILGATIAVIGAIFGVFIKKQWF